MSKTRLLQAFGGAVLALGIAASAEAQFQPGLTIDLRLNDGSKFIDFLPPGTALPINIYAIVMGEGPGVEGFQSMQGAFLAVRSPRVGSGGFRGQILPAGDLDQRTFETTLPALSPFNAEGATRGASKEIGAPDEAIDLGDEWRRGIDRGDLVSFRAPTMQIFSGTLIDGGQGREFHIGRIVFRIDDGRLPGLTEINWVFRQNQDGSPRPEAALFRFDGEIPADGLDGISVGSPITLGYPEPTANMVFAAWALWLASAGARRARWLVSVARREVVKMPDAIHVTERKEVLSMSKTRLIQACSGVVVALGVAASAEAQYQPGLTIDLRLADGTKYMDVWNLSPGTAIPINVYAVVMGTGAGVEGFQSAQGAFLGTRWRGAGPSGQILPAGDLEELNFETVVPALSPWTASGAQRGASKEIGTPDGVIDLGDEWRRGDDLGDLVVFRSPSMQVTSGTLINDGQGREFHIGRIEFVTSGGMESGLTEINWVYRQLAQGGPRAEAALFRYDGNNPADGTDEIRVGAPIVSIPEPAAITVLAACALCLATRRSARRRIPRAADLAAAQFRT